MAEYIEREVVMAALSYYPIRNPGPLDIIPAVLETARKAVARIPAADVVEVKHGRWLPCGFGKEIMCSVCRGELDDTWEYRCCPNCGARMDGE